MFQTLRIYQHFVFVHAVLTNDSPFLSLTNNVDIYHPIILLVGYEVLHRTN